MVIFAAGIGASTSKLIGEKDVGRILTIVLLQDTDDLNSEYVGLSKVSTKVKAKEDFCRIANVPWCSAPFGKEINLGFAIEKSTPRREVCRTRLYGTFSLLQSNSNPVNQEHAQIFLARAHLLFILWLFFFQLNQRMLYLVAIPTIRLYFEQILDPPLSGPSCTTISLLVVFDNAAFPDLADERTQSYSPTTSNWE